MNRGMFAGSTAKQSMTIHDVLERYLAEESPGRAYSAADMSRLKPLTTRLGAYHVHKLTHVDLAAYKRDRLALWLPQTVTHELNLLHRAYLIVSTKWGSAMCCCSNRWAVCRALMPKIEKPETRASGS
jgi:hypothetical protein